METPSFLSCELVKSATSGAFDGVVTPSADKLHQNHYYVVRDLPFGEQKVYLQVNRRQMRCEACPKKFSENLEFVKKTRTYTERLKKKILSKLLESDLKNVAQKNGVS